MIALSPDDDRYPKGLLDLRSPPDPLWVDGDPGLLDRRGVAVVGTRRMTPYGARVAREIAEAVASAGLIVVSGLAQGIDSAAHEAALEGNGATVAVLGAGITSYLAEIRGRRRALAHRIRASGALVSEFPPDAPARRWTFAKRDATMAALAEVTVVVEAPGDSGALITAADARDLRRPVYAVPGPLGANTSAGTNALIARGDARILTGAELLIGAFGLSRPPATSHDASARILDALAAAPLDPDALARRLGMSAREVTAIVARLVVRGAVGTAPDGRLVRR